jgi:hypothetical protein
MSNTDRALKVWYELRPQFDVPRVSAGFLHDTPDQLNARIEQACRGHFLDGWEQALRWREGAEYAICEGTYSSDVARDVQSMMREGWRPLGPLALSWGDDRCHFAQAMTRGVQP